MSTLAIVPLKRSLSSFIFAASIDFSGDLQFSEENEWLARKTINPKP
jgi:hypothetical protein